MIESKNDTSKNLEKALQALKQAQQRVANEKKKQNEKKRKAGNHHRYIMGGIIVKYFPGCYRYLFWHACCRLFRYLETNRAESRVRSERGRGNNMSKGV